MLISFSTILNVPNSTVSEALKKKKKKNRTIAPVTEQWHNGVHSFLIFHSQQLPRSVCPCLCFSAPHAWFSRQAASYALCFLPLVIRLFQRGILMQVIPFSALPLTFLERAFTQLLHLSHIASRLRPFSSNSFMWPTLQAISLFSSTFLLPVSYVPLIPGFHVHGLMHLRTGSQRECDR